MPPYSTHLTQTVTVLSRCFELHLPRLFPRKMRVGPLQNLPCGLCLSKTTKGTPQFQRQRQTDLIDCTNCLIQWDHFVIACQNHIGAGERIASAHDIFAETWPFNTVSNRIAGKPCDILKPYRRRIQRLPVYSVFILTMKRETATIQLCKPHLICDKSIFSTYVLFHS